MAPINIFPFWNPPTWNLDAVLPQPGKVAIVTGANSGIGYEVALQLAKKEIEVVMACRNFKKAVQARDKILRRNRGAKLEILDLDLADLGSVRMFAQRIHSKKEKIDLLINNAGIMMTPYGTSGDGFELQLATNYLGHYALTGLLLPLLVKAEEARVVTLSSLSYRWSVLRFEDLNFEQQYSKTAAYGQSKRACLVFSYELQRRLQRTDFPIRSVAAHPGIANTDLDRHFPKVLRSLGNWLLQSADCGALPVLFAALNAELQGGEFIGPGGLMQIRGQPRQVSSDRKSLNPVIGQRLWEVSEQLTEVCYLNDQV